MTRETKVRKQKTKYEGKESRLITSFFVFCASGKGCGFVDLHVGHIGPCVTEFASVLHLLWHSLPSSSAVIFYRSSLEHLHLTIGILTSGTLDFCRRVAGSVFAEVFGYCVFRYDTSRTYGFL